MREAAGDRVALRGPDQHGMRAVAFDLEVEHGGAANLREKLRKRANGHLHGQVFTLGGVEHAGDEFFLTGAAVGALAETGALLHAEHFEIGHGCSPYPSTGKKPWW